ncbi:hypothetical protein [Crenobacter cavernae]|nr:hypothetical protein [Crenobacter cavernae]
MTTRFDGTEYYVATDELKMAGPLLKNEQDVALFERLSHFARRRA